MNKRMLLSLFFVSVLAMSGAVYGSLTDVNPNQAQVKYRHQRRHKRTEQGTAMFSQINQEIAQAATVAQVNEAIDRMKSYNRSNQYPLTYEQRHQLKMAAYNKRAQIRGSNWGGRDEAGEGKRSHRGQHRRGHCSIDAGPHGRANHSGKGCPRRRQ